MAFSISQGARAQDEANQNSSGIKNKVVQGAAYVGASVAAVRGLILSRAQGFVLDPQSNYTGTLYLTARYGIWLGPLSFLAPAAGGAIAVVAVKAAAIAGAGFIVCDLTGRIIYRHQNYGALACDDVFKDGWRLAKNSANRFTSLVSSTGEVLRLDQLYLKQRAAGQLAQINGQNIGYQEYLNSLSKSSISQISTLAKAEMERIEVGPDQNYEPNSRTAGSR